LSRAALDDAHALEVVDARVRAHLGAQDRRVVEEDLHPLEAVERLDQPGVVVVEAALDDAPVAPAELVELHVGHGRAAPVGHVEAGQRTHR
jgi:hypothetical protein